MGQELDREEARKTSKGERGELVQARAKLRKRFGGRCSSQHQATPYVGHQQYASTRKHIESKRGILRVWCASCRNLREQHNIHHPTIVLEMLVHGPGDAPIVWFDSCMKF